MQRILFHTAILLFVSLFSPLVSQAYSQSPQQSEVALPSSLRWYANIAKSRGQTSIELASMETHDYSPPLTESLRTNLLIKGNVLSQADGSDEFRIYRWYKVRVISKGPDKPVTNAFEHASVPQSLRSNDPNEIIIRIPGGTTVIEGVSITQPGPAGPEVNQDYAFFLEKTASGFYTLGFATTPVALSPDGSFNLPPTGGRLFTRQLRVHHSYQDVQQLAMRTK